MSLLYAGFYYHQEKGASLQKVLLFEDSPPKVDYMAEIYTSFFLRAEERSAYFSSNEELKMNSNFLSENSLSEIYDFIFLHLM